MENESQEMDWNQEETSERRQSKRHREKKQALEEQVNKVAQNEVEKAREIVLIRKDLLRLHFKVKNFHNQARVTNGILQTIIVLLLIAVLYRLYTIK
jgi:hypothetical protein